MQQPNYLILDGAKMRFDLDKAKELNVNHQCLYKGKSAINLGGVAPWLFTFQKGAPFANWFAENSPEKSWGILFHSEDAFETVYKHLRKFLLVKTEEEKELYFRYYDPRVLNTFMPSCDGRQLADFFGPIKAFYAETQPNKGLLYTFDEINKELESAIITWSKILK